MKSKIISAVACSLAFLAASALFAQEEAQDNFYDESLGAACEIRSELTEDQDCEITDNQDVAKCETCDGDDSGNKKNKQAKEGKCGSGKCGEGKCGG